MMWDFSGRRRDRVLLLGLNISDETMYVQDQECNVAILDPYDDLLFGGLSVSSPAGADNRSSYTSVEYRVRQKHHKPGSPSSIHSLISSSTHALIHILNHDFPRHLRSNLHFDSI